QRDAGAVEPAQPIMPAMLEPEPDHQLHADANAEKRPLLLDDGAHQRLLEPRLGGDAAPAIGEGALARQHDAIGRGDIPGLVRDDHPRRGADFGRGAFEGLGGRAQIARAAIHQGDERHNDPPSTPLVEGTASAARGSMVTAWRSARARPLKQDSTMWWLFSP